MNHYRLSPPKISQLFNDFHPINNSFLPLYFVRLASLSLTVFISTSTSSNKIEMKDAGYCAYCKNKVKCTEREKELKEE